MSNQFRSEARWAGIFFLVAMFSSLVGGSIMELVIGDFAALDEIRDGRGQVIAGSLLELTNALAVIGIIAALWAPLREYSQAMSAGYLGLRVIEAIVCASAAFIPISMLVLVGDGGRFPHESDSLNFAFSLATTRDHLLSYGVPFFFGLGALVLYVVALRSHLIPRYIAIWGLIAAPMIMAGMFVDDLALKAPLALPIITNEIWLGIVLIRRGFGQGDSAHLQHT